MFDKWLRRLIVDILNDIQIQAIDYWKLLQNILEQVQRKKLEERHY